VKSSLIPAAIDAAQLTQLNFLFSTSTVAVHHHLHANRERRKIDELRGKVNAEN
jgi:hypothetical protein